MQNEDPESSLKGSLLRHVAATQQTDIQLSPRPSRPRVLGGNDEHEFARQIWSVNFLEKIITPHNPQRNLRTHPKSYLTIDCVPKALGESRQPPHSFFPLDPLLNCLQFTSYTRSTMISVATTQVMSVMYPAMDLPIQSHLQIVHDRTDARESIRRWLSIG